ncbi:MAG: DpnI domain-containing protein [Candidatus Acidiferrales bacterium]
MNLTLPTEGLDRYKSNAQRARVCTEPWGAENLYCPACSSPRIKLLPPNTPALDFDCPSCQELFQLKSKSSSFGRRVQDGAFKTMKHTILTNRTPNLFLMQYSLAELLVTEVFLIPRFVFSLSILEERTPLSAHAVRAGWIGCNFLLHRIPLDARIPIVANGRPTPASSVRKAYNRLRPLEKLKVEKRGWTLDVLQIVRALNKTEFSLSEVYAHADELSMLHPGNSHITDKIRQQLQFLRNLGILQFLDNNGRYRLL